MTSKTFMEITRDDCCETCRSYPCVCEVYKRHGLDPTLAWREPTADEAKALEVVKR